MGVVDAQRNGAVLGEPCGQPEQPVQQRIARVAAGRLCLGVEQRRGRRGRPLEQLGALVCANGVKQLPHDAERKLALELQPAGGQHLHPAPRASSPAASSSRVLPRPGRRLDDDDRAVTIVDRSDGVRYAPKLILALQQRPTGAFNAHLHESRPEVLLRSDPTPEWRGGGSRRGGRNPLRDLGPALKDVTHD